MSTNDLVPLRWREALSRGKIESGLRAFAPQAGFGVATLHNALNPQDRFDQAAPGRIFEPRFGWINCQSPPFAAIARLGLRHVRAARLSSFGAPFKPQQ